VAEAEAKARAEVDGCRFVAATAGADAEGRGGRLDVGRPHVHVVSIDPESKSPGKVQAGPGLAGQGELVHRRQMAAGQRRLVSVELPVGFQSDDPGSPSERLPLVPQRARLPLQNILKGGG
jgi:hypothetical protein